MKDIIKKHLLTILCVISIIVLFFPLAKVVSSVEVFGQSGSSAVKVSGFDALKKSFFAYFLLIGPILLIAMNYIKPLEKYKGILAIAVPIVCIVALIIVIARASSISASGESAYMDVEVRTKIGIGAVFAFLVYIGTIVAGAITYHNFTLDKAGLEKIKDGSAEFFGNAQEKVSAAAKTISKKVKKQSDAPAESEETVVAAEPVKAEKPAAASPAKKSTDMDRADDVLALIAKLSEMKNAGVLTEEEFLQKKQQLLEEI